VRQVAESVLDCPIGSFPSKYLGLPLSLKKLRKDEVQPILDKLTKKLSFWKARLMTREGRVAYVRFVMTGSLIYHLMALDVEPWLLRAIDTVRRDFLWVGRGDARGGHCLVSWQAVCKPKHLGGLGLHNLRWLNAALRARWIWFQKTSLDRPWPGLEFSVRSEAHSLVTASAIIDVRDGSRVLFWEDPWIYGLSVAALAPELLLLVRPGLRRSRVLRDGLPNRAWVRDIAGTLTVDAVVQFLRLWGTIAVANVHVVPGNCDGFKWKWSSDGAFCSRSAYRTFFAGQVALPGAAQLWHSFAPMKFRFHGWLSLWQRCWTADRLQRHGLPNHAVCPLCNTAAETYDHLALQCPLSTSVWVAAFRLIGWNPPLPTSTCTIRKW
jgi:mannosylglycoprotein endo-beta-mannosidase